MKKAKNPIAIMFLSCGTLLMVAGGIGMLFEYSKEAFDLFITGIMFLTVGVCAWWLKVGVQSK